jgi:predicted nucleic acid-binding protein
MAAYLIDTDVLIDISRGNGDAADFVDALPGDIFIGRISAMKLIVRRRNKRDQKFIEKFISLYSIQELSDSIGREAHQQIAGSDFRAAIRRRNLSVEGPCVFGL